jgi:hypothetical protein
MTTKHTEKANEFKCKLYALRWALSSTDDKSSMRSHDLQSQIKCVELNLKNIGQSYEDGTLMSAMLDARKTRKRKR